MMLAPACTAARATAGFMVSMETGTDPRLTSASITGITRRNSSCSLTGAASGRVDSPPTSIQSAPSPTNSKARSTAAVGSKNCPPSENESGVTLTMPMSRVGRGKRNSKWRARRIILLFRHHLLDRSDHTVGDGRDQFIRHADLGIGRLAEHVALVVHIIDDHELTRFRLGDFARKEIHSRQGRDFADDLLQGIQFEFGPRLGRDQALIVVVAIPPTEPDRAEDKEHAEIHGPILERARHNPPLQ